MVEQLQSQAIERTVADVRRRSMQLAFPIAVLVAWMGFVTIAWAGDDVPRTIGQMENFELYKSTRPRPDFQWQTQDGNSMSLADFEGKVVLFNFWATWCAPCIREMPSLDRLNATLGGDKFVVVTLNIDRAGASVAMKMFRRLKLKTLAFYLDPTLKIAREMGVTVMPSTFLFDAQGRELGKMEGAAEWDSEEALALMKYFVEHPQYADRLPSIGKVRVK